MTTHAFMPEAEPRTPSRAGLIALAVAGAMVLLVVGFAVGSHRSGTRAVTGPAYVGDQVVTMTVEGTSYGFRDSIPWIDAGGAYHEGGWPQCLGDSPGPVPSVTFGVTRVDYPNDSSADQVVYVDCRT